MGPIWDAELRVCDAKNFGLVSPGTHRNKFVKKSLIKKMEFCSRCCFCVCHEKHTDKLSVHQQSIYCVKTARNALSRKHFPFDLLYSISSNKPGPKSSLRQFLRRNVLFAFLPNEISSFDYNPKSCRHFTEGLVNF